MEKIAFIINPISGGKGKSQIPDRILSRLDANQFDPGFYYTAYAGHASVLTREALEKGAGIVVAVGGDGTVNQVARELVNSRAKLGLIPMGSGDGLARHLRISRIPEKAMEVINRGKIERIDSAMADEHFFINLAGIGFDARVSQLFAHAPRRGFWSYAGITIREFSRYKSEKIELTIDGMNMQKEGFVFCFANGSQYGNNAFIAPNADLTDGKLSISILKPFDMMAMPGLGLRLFSKKISLSQYVESLEGKEIRVTRHKADVLHVDGEPIQTKKEFSIRIIPQSIQVLIP